MEIGAVEISLETGPDDAERREWLDQGQRALMGVWDIIAEQRCVHLVEAHERFSAPVEQKRFGVVYPVLPMDVLGIYVLMPASNHS